MGAPLAAGRSKVAPSSRTPHPTQSILNNNEIPVCHLGEHSLVIKTYRVIDNKHYYYIFITSTIVMDSSLLPASLSYQASPLPTYLFITKLAKSENNMGLFLELLDSQIPMCVFFIQQNSSIKIGTFGKSKYFK